MKTYALIIAILANFTLTQPGELTFKDLLGEWYKSSYLDNLQTEKSAYRAGTGHYFVMFDIRYDSISQKYQIMKVFNFHEGLTFELNDLMPESDSTYSFDCIDAGNFKEKHQIQLLNRNEVRFRTENFRRMQNFRHFLNEQTIAGVYKDSTENLYFFYPDGFTIWPNKKYFYHISLDYILTNIDYFFIENVKKENRKRIFYPFKKTNHTLEILRIKDGFDDSLLLEENCEVLIKLLTFQEVNDYLLTARFQNFESKNKIELNLLRNEIFARHRHSFNKPELQNYFRNQNWYQEFPGHQVSGDELSPEETTILNKIIMLENKF